jgi:hypothetical protein
MTLRNIRSVDGCKRQRSDIDSVQNWCLDNGMSLNVGKTTVVAFTRNRIHVNFSYMLHNLV